MNLNAKNTAQQRVMIVNRKGLHARASAKFAKLATQFDARVTVTHETQSAFGGSIMDLLMLVAAKGCVIEITAEGADAPQAVTALTSLVAEGFGELQDGDTTY